MEPGYLKLYYNDKLLLDNKKYRQVVAELVHLETVTRPVISVTVNVLSHRNEKPIGKNWNTIKRVIKYQKTSKDLKLIINKQKYSNFKNYTDADYTDYKCD